MPCGECARGFCPLPILVGMHWVYILECSDGNYYVGSTWNVEHRVWQRGEGLGSEYTKMRRPSG